jgi:hypothetical protein
VPRKKLSMRKLCEVLRLRFELNLSQNQIARSCAISQGAVCQYLKRAQVAGITWPLPEGWNEARLEEALFKPSPRRVAENHRPVPDFAYYSVPYRLHGEMVEIRSTARTVEP